MNKEQVMSMLDNKIDNNTLSIDLKNNLTYSVDLKNDISTDSSGTKELSCWHYWQEWYYPSVIRESYPVYINERAIDKGKQAFEIIKAMMDKRFVQLNTVKDFVDLMDLLIRIL